MRGDGRMRLIHYDEQLEAATREAAGRLPPQWREDFCRMMRGEPAGAAFDAWLDSPEGEPAVGEMERLLREDGLMREVFG